MKIALLTPHLPPEKCGVGDFSYCLSKQLQSENHRVTVYTAGEGQAIEHVNVVHTKLPNQLGLCAPLIDAIIRSDQDVLVLQFAPNLYFLNQVATYLPLEAFLLRLRQLWRGKIVLFVHEAHYPLESSLRGIGYGLPQLTHFYALAQLSDKMIFSSKWLYNQMAKRIPWRKKRFFYSPVGSNLDFGKSYVSEACQKELLSVTGTFVFFHFGGPHPSHAYDYMFAALHEYIEVVREPTACLICVGIDQLTVETKISEFGFDNLKGLVSGLSYRSHSEVAAWIQRADLALCPFTDGVSTRRGSLMACLAGGLPVSTTSGERTTDDVNWSNFTLITNVEERDEYAEHTINGIAGGKDYLNNLGQTGKQFYERNFSWPVISNKLIEVISS